MIHVIRVAVPFCSVELALGLAQVFRGPLDLPRVLRPGLRPPSTLDHVTSRQVRGGNEGAETAEVLLRGLHSLAEDRRPLVGADEAKKLGVMLMKNLLGTCRLDGLAVRIKSTAKPWISKTSLTVPSVHGGACWCAAWCPLPEG